MKQILIALLIFLILGNGCALSSEPKSKIRIKETVLTVEWARSDAEKTKGLQGRFFLGEDEGMIFDYGQEKMLSFWMKDTHIPLSIAFIDSKGVIQEIANMKPNSEEPHRSAKKVRYALEVNQGWFDRHHVQVGDYIEL
ncbi:MAG: DUF192 domain-containing protein [Candidatus Omnitrophica bacterium]|nr:DUF192 domain-containing protein [Candidatus Omnitrophota bacterium]